MIIFKKGQELEHKHEFGVVEWDQGDDNDHLFGESDSSVAVKVITSSCFN